MSLLPLPAALRRWYPYLLLGLIMILGGFLRYDTFVTGHKNLTINYNYAREGTAISLYKGWGFRIYPIPDYRKRGFIDPEEYLQWKPQRKVDPKRLPYLFMNPGPAALLALTYKLFGLKYRYYQIVQLVLTWLLIPAMFYIGRSIFDSVGAGLLAALFYALSPLDMKYSLTVGREIHTNLATVGMLVGVAYLLKRGPDISWRRGIWTGILVGLLLGLCAYFKGTVFALFLLFPLVLFCYYPWRKAAVFGGTALLVAGLVLLPWLVRNYRLTGKVFVGQEAQYLAIWGGLGYQANPVGMNATDSVSLRSIQTYHRLRRVSAGNFYLGGSIQYETTSKGLVKRFLEWHPHTYYRIFLSNLYQNLFNFTEWAYYNFFYSSVPDFGLIRSLLGKNIYLTLRAQIVPILKIIPILSFLGLLLALWKTPKAAALWLVLIGAAGSISLAASHHCKYITHVLSIHYLGCAFFLSFSADRLRTLLHWLTTTWRRKSIVAESTQR